MPHLPLRYPRPITSPVSRLIPGRLQSSPGSHPPVPSPRALYRIPTVNQVPFNSNTLLLHKASSLVRVPSLELHHWIPGDKFIQLVYCVSRTVAHPPLSHCRSIISGGPCLPAYPPISHPPVHTLPAVRITYILYILLHTWTVHPQQPTYPPRLKRKESNKANKN